MAAEVISNATKRFASGAVVDLHLRWPLEPPGVLILFGPSGSGKSTVLRCLAGLERPEQGTIRFRDEVWADAERGYSMPPQARRVGFMFQDFALFPTHTVVGNIAYGLGALTAPDRDARIGEAVRLLHLEGLEDRRPRQLSGGQQQRVALARAIAMRPRLILLDEPLSALDAPTRMELRGGLRRLLRTLAIPSVVVTHDWEEALALGDTVAIMTNGRIVQIGPPAAVFNAPRDVDVARIVGMETVVAGQCTAYADGLATVEAGGVRLLALSSGDPGPEVYACIRAEDVIVEPLGVAATSARNHLRGTIRSVTPMSALVSLEIDCGFPLSATITRVAAEDLKLQAGSAVTAAIKAGAVHLIPREGAGATAGTRAHRGSG